ncbi:MAG: tRNA epoxyqueuosine(34) reductase QueG [Deltaproteobacteria bacterium]|nr:tRNA epoxyqueuosine(34) reductase QueG [Deltaproteobacteria bacterium]
MSIHIGNLPSDWRCIVQMAEDAGAVAVGVARASAVPDHIFQRYVSWVQSNASAEMTYLRKNLPERRDPTSCGVVQFATTVVSLAFPYARNNTLPPIWTFVSDHAAGRDYHKTIRQRLKQIANQLSIHFSNTSSRIFVDSGPVMERTWATLCGVGTPGRNGMIIVPGFGPQVLLGEIILATPKIAPPAMEIATGEPFANCHDCNRCIESCPTHALRADGTINVRKCLSYITIEKQSFIPPSDVLNKIEKIFGCDKCVSACPHNRPLGSIIEPPSTENLAASLEELINLPSQTLQTRIQGTCLFRTGAEQIQRTARQILKNIASKQENTR